MPPSRSLSPLSSVSSCSLSSRSLSFTPPPIPPCTTTETKKNLYALCKKGDVHALAAFLHTSPLTTDMWEDAARIACREGFVDLVVFLDRTDCIEFDDLCHCLYHHPHTNMVQFLWVQRRDLFRPSCLPRIFQGLCEDGGVVMCDWLLDHMSPAPIPDLMAIVIQGTPNRAMLEWIFAHFLYGSAILDAAFRCACRMSDYVTVDACLDWHARELDLEEGMRCAAARRHHAIVCRIMHAYQALYDDDAQ